MLLYFNWETSIVNMISVFKCSIRARCAVLVMSVRCKVTHTTALHPSGSGHHDLRNRADGPPRVRGERITASALFKTSDTPG